MNTTIFKKTILILFVLIMGNFAAISQSKYASGKVDLVLNGTSTMHDWEMKSATGECDATFTMDNAGKITGISKMSFKTPAKTLKSGKGGMDKNAYKALKTDSNPNISAVLTNATVKSSGDNMYTITGKIKLTIAGTTLDTDLIAQAKVNADNTINVSGEKKIAMKDYNMDPPSFMLGTVKTGNEVFLKFNLKMLPQQTN